MRIVLALFLLVPAVRAGDETLEERVARLEQSISKLAQREAELDRLRERIRELEAENARLRGEKRPRAAERLVSARAVVARLEKRADELSAKLAAARENEKRDAANGLEVELHRTREVLQTAMHLASVLSGLIEEKAPASRKEREEEASRWERKLEVQLGRLAPEATQPEDLVALLAIAHMKRQSAELAKNRVFFDMRLQAMKALDSGKTSTKDIEEAFSVVGRAPDSVKRVTEIVALVDEWLARHGRVEKARRDGTWNEAEVVALFKLKARTDRLMFEELKTLSDGLEAWVTGPGDKGGLAFAEEEEEEIKEKPVKEPH